MAAWDGELHRFPASCDTWRCGWCGPQKARRKAAIVEWARPTRFVTLTQAPDDWQRLRQKVRKVRLKIASDGYEVEWAWVVERGSRTGMVHLHALQHGSFVPQRYLQDRWGAIVHLRRISDTGAAVRYTTKHAARRVVSYTLKGARAELDEHLDLNGGRGVHMSRRFLHGRTSAEVWRLLHPPSALKWVQVPSHLPDDQAAALVSSVG